MGNDYAVDKAVCDSSSSRTMWTVPGVKGVLLWTNSHSINERMGKGYEVKVRYEGNRVSPTFVHPNDRLVYNWEDDGYYGNLTCMSPDIYKYK